MRFSFISDTHGHHERLMLPGGDILFHCGDISRRGNQSDTLSFFDWFSRQDYAHRVLIVGNHDMSFDPSFCPDARAEVLHQMPDNVVYLENNGTIIEGVKIWGSPYTPRFNSHAFNVDRGAAIAAHWQQIPTDVDVLLTHGPSYGVLDTNFHNETTGCEELAKVMRDPRYNIKIHAFGHIHESRGVSHVGKTHHINASSTDRLMHNVYEPVTLSYPSLFL